MKCFVLFTKDNENKRVICESIHESSLLTNSDTDTIVYYNGLLIVGGCYDYYLYKAHDHYEIKIYDRMPCSNFTLQIFDYKEGIRRVFVPE